MVEKTYIILQNTQIIDRVLVDMNIVEGASDKDWEVNEEHIIENWKKGSVIQ